MRTKISDGRSEIGIARRGTLGELDRKLCERHGGDDASLLRHNIDRNGELWGISIGNRASGMAAMMRHCYVLTMT